MASPRYLVGIDLGTTNIVLAYCEITPSLKESPVSIFGIDQLVGPGEVARRPQLPSFRFHPAPGQLAEGDRTLPWREVGVEGDISSPVIGEWARELGAKVEGRQISSAKSWLSHQSVDRESEILPWAGASDVEKVSPVTATASYLNHLRQSWNHHNPVNVLENQEVVITVPASFDESARKLTLEAAKQAGLDKVLLLEEPQAVCYDWYARHSDSARDELENTPLILVCDVGGGTTDLSLIEAQLSNQQLSLNRIGVGEHLMLGGDNLDLALAHLAEQRFNQNKKLTASGLSKLIQQTRAAKEKLLGQSETQEVKITTLGSGSRLLGGTKSVSVTRDEVHKIALDGFFPLIPASELPDKKRSAVVEFGLPYVSDPAVSRHIAEFLSVHQSVSRNALGIDDDTPAIPVGLLLNGGVFNSELVTGRISELMTRWRGSPVTVLSNPHPDLSVALGAVAFAKARRGAQLKIGGGAARSYLLHLPEKKGTDKAICLLAKGTEEGQEVRLTGRKFALTLGEPVRFNLLTSTHDLLTEHKPAKNGALYKVDADVFSPLPPYITTLESQNGSSGLHANQKQRAEVQLACKLTEVGTLQLECVDADNNDQRWAVEFEIRGQKALENEDCEVSPGLKASLELITSAYSGNKKSADPKVIKTLVKELERRLGKREEWSFSDSRQVFDAFSKGRKRRRRSEQHERNWLRLAGYALRPGFGAPTDEWRMEQVWSLYQQGIQYQNHQGWSDWWVFWRRVSGGLNEEQQETILTDIAKYLHPGSLRNAKVAKEAQERSYEAMVRLAASMENIYVEDKVHMFTWFLNKAVSESQHAQAHWWALGRLAARKPMYGSQHNVIPREKVEEWLPQLLEQDWSKQPIIGFAAVMMCRKTGDRLLDISDALRTEVAAKLRAGKAPASWIELVETVKEMDENEARRAYGDALPHGLHLVKE